MKTYFFLMFILSTLMTPLVAQKYFTRQGNISFFSSAPLEDIEAYNSKVTSVIDINSGKMEFAVLIKAFSFKKALMQQHFNENYMESDQYPKATFKGEILDFDLLDFNDSSEKKVNVSGALTVHGVTKNIVTKAILIKQGNKIIANSSFDIQVADYNIKIPKLVRDNIAKVVSVKVDVDLFPMQS